MLINLPDPLNFLVRSLTHEFYVQNWSWSKKGGMQKGGLVYWVSKIFWSWSKKREMRKGGWVRKGWVRSSSAPGCEKKFSGASRPHPPKKNPVYAPAHCRNEIHHTTFHAITRARPDDVKIERTQSDEVLSDEELMLEAGDLESLLTTKHRWLA